MQKLAINKVKNWRVWWPLARVVPSSFLTKGRIFLLREMPKKSICAEIGTYNGKFAKKILYFTNPQQLHLIDPWEGSWYDKAPSQNKMNERYQHVLKRFAREINRGQVAINRGYSHEVHNNFEDNYFDWIYIDGNHQYEFVKQDLELYYSKIKMGGFITGFDRILDIAKAQQELMVAQQRTEQRVEELAVAQQRTERRVEELAVAQQRTEQTLVGYG